MKEEIENNLKKENGLQPSPEAEIPASVPVTENNRVRRSLTIFLPALLLAVLLFFVLSNGFSAPRPDEKADRTPPSIMLTRDNRYFVLPGEDYEEEGYAAYDNLDGDLTRHVQVTILEDMVRYEVSDSTGNITVRFRRIPYAEKESR